MSNNLRFIHPVGLAQIPGYTQVVEVSAGRIVYIAGQLPTDGQGRLVGGGDFELQARQTFNNIGLALHAAGMTSGNVVKLGVYLTDLSHLETLRRVRDGFVDTVRPPASTLIQVAGLAYPGALLEVEVIAASST